MTVQAVPPRVSGWSVLGALPRLLREKHEFWLAARARYGDIYTLDLGVTEIVILCHPRHIDHVFRRQAHNYTDKGGARGFRLSVLPSIRNGLVTLDAEDAWWRQQRRIIQPHFLTPYLTSMVEAVVRVIEDKIAQWDRYADAPTPVDVLPLISRLAVDTTVRAVFGTDLEARDVDALIAAFRCVLDYMWLSMIETALPAWCPWPGRRRHRRAIATIDRLAARVIVQCLQNARESSDLMRVLVALGEAEQDVGMTPEQRLDEVVSLLVAGLETVGAPICWAFYLLTQHPEKMRALEAEVDTMLGTRRPTYDDLGKLSYALMVVKESLRLCSPIYQIQRRATADDEIDGFHIPAGTVVAALIYAVHHHPEVWEHAERFEPERFTRERSADRHPLAWMPFGAGRRVCVAREFAQIQGQLILAQVVQRFRVTAATRRPPRLFMSTGIRLKGGTWVHLHRRS